MQKEEIYAENERQSILKWTTSQDTLVLRIRFYGYHSINRLSYDALEP